MNVLEYTIAFVSLLIIAVIVTITRTYVRRRINKGIHIEDWFAIAACIVLLIQVVLSTLFTRNYTYLLSIQPTLTNPPKNSEESAFLQRIFVQIRVTLQLQIGSHIGFLTALWLIKYSFLFFYKRLSEGRPVSKLWLFTFLFVSCAFVGNVIGFFFVCVPFSTYFDTTCKDQTGRTNAASYGVLATDVLSDILIMLIPLRLIRQLRMSLLQKLGLACLFCLGFVVVILSVARTIRINAGGKGAYPQSDPRWVALWSIAEETTAILVCCLPAIRKLFSTHRARRVSESNRVTNSAGSRRRSYFRRWSSKYGLKTSASGGSNRTDSSLEMEAGLYSDTLSPPISPQKPDAIFSLTSIPPTSNKGSLSFRIYEDPEMEICGVIPPLGSSDGGTLYTTPTSLSPPIPKPVPYHF